MLSEYIKIKGVAKDSVDLRDYTYVPRLSLLPASHMPWDNLLTEDNIALLVRLQQGDTCVGHALAAVIDIQGRLRGDAPQIRASAMMLYAMARFYDGFRTEEGVRSLRAAIKGFFHHGVCSDNDDEAGWPDRESLKTWPSAQQANAATSRTLGTYSRLQPILHHYHSAVTEAGAILVTATTHAGWRMPDQDGAIPFDTNLAEEGLHAFVIVGYNEKGFLILNSWGSDWGGVPATDGRGLARGLAIWRYDDWARSIADGWVLRLGVPGPEVFAIGAGEQGINRSISEAAQQTVPYRRLRGHFINLNYGALQENGPHATPHDAVEATITNIRERLEGPGTKGLVIALPGVFEDERRSFAKAVRLKTRFAAAGLEFLTFFWAANIAADMQAVLNDIFTRCRERVGASDALDALFEQTAQGAGRAFWRDIERHAYRAVMPCIPDAAMWDAKAPCDLSGGKFGDIVESLAQVCVRTGKPMHLLANGSGALVVDALLKKAQDRGRGPRDWLPGLGNLVMTFPAVPQRQANARIIPLAEMMHDDRPGSVSIFVPDKQLEGLLTTAGYGRSILQLVSRSFLDNAPQMLGSHSDAVPQPFMRPTPPPRPYRLDQQELEDDPTIEACVVAAVIGTGAHQPHTVSQQEKPMDTAYIPKITLQELNDKIVNDTLTPEEADHYLMLDENASGPFAPVWVINPATVQIPRGGSRSALRLNSANAIARAKRRAAYELRIAGGYDGLRIACDGDSWTQYPLILQDVIDYVSKPFAVFDTSAAGDLLENIAKKREYIAALDYSGADILLLSAGGNDVCANGRLQNFLEEFDPDLKPAEYLKRSYQKVLDQAIASYERICRDVNKHAAHVSIIVHGYDYVIPDNGRWLGQPMASRNITDRKLQRQIAAQMIDLFNAALRRMADSMDHVSYVDCRNSVADHQWYDELHPDNDGFKKVAAKILAKIDQVTQRQPRSQDGATTRKPTRGGSGNRAYSLHVGLNAYDPVHYAGDSGILYGCENDARAMHDLAQRRGYMSQILLTGQATREAVLAEIARAARDLRNGDQFLFTIAAHGAQITDMNGDERESYNQDRDSTFCLFDSQLIDDEFWNAMSTFEAGVRIVSIADTCHSGTSVRKAKERSLIKGEMPDGSFAPKSRGMSRELARKVEEDNRDFYKRVAENVPHVNMGILTSPLQSRIDASVIHLAACQDDQEAMDGAENGAFTAALLRVWNNGDFNGTYRRLHEKIGEDMAELAQQPKLFEPGARDAAFLRQTPFLVVRDATTGGSDDQPPRADKRNDKTPDQTDDLNVIDEDGAVDTMRGASARSGGADGVPKATVDAFRGFMEQAQLTHFDPAEFLTLGASHFVKGPGQGLNAAPPQSLWPNIMQTAQVLDKLRDRLNAPIRISSAYRTKPYNTAIDGAANSWHLQFRACDIIVDGVPPAKVADMLQKMKDEGEFKGGVGLYRGFTHVDTRGKNVYWVAGGNDRNLSRLRQIAETISPSRSRAADGAAELHEKLTTATAALNGAEVMALADGLSADQRQAVLYSTQFAQRAADAVADRFVDRTLWWTTYNQALAALGWTVVGSVARQATDTDLKASVDSMALTLMSGLVAPGGLTAIKAVLDALRDLAETDEKLDLLDKRCRQDGGGAVQIGQASLEGGVVSVTTGAVQFAGEDTRSKILFASWGKSEQDIWLAAERLILNEDYYFTNARQIVQDRLGGQATKNIWAFQLKKPRA